MHCESLLGRTMYQQHALHGITAAKVMYAGIGSSLEGSGVLVEIAGAAVGVMKAPRMAVRRQTEE